MITSQTVELYGVVERAVVELAERAPAGEQDPQAWAWGVLLGAVTGRLLALCGRELAERVLVGNLEALEAQVNAFRQQARGAT